VSTPRLTPASEGWYSIYLPQRDGRLSWLWWLATFWFLRLCYPPTHPSTNRARRRVTRLIETNVLPLSHATTASVIVRVKCWMKLWYTGSAAQVRGRTADDWRMRVIVRCSSRCSTTIQSKHITHTISASLDYSNTLSPFTRPCQSYYHVMISRTLQNLRLLLWTFTLLVFITAW